MIRWYLSCVIVILSLMSTHSPLAADEPGIDDNRFRLIDIFQLEHATDPQISPDGKRIVYVRNFMDIMTDGRRSNLWIINADGSDHRPLTTGNRSDSSPRWAPDGNRLLYVSNVDDTTQMYCRWMDSGLTAKLTNLTSGPSGVAWSPDGKWIAFTMHVPGKSDPFISLPEKPEGAKWSEPARVVQKLVYRSDGHGFVKDNFAQLFVLPGDGGTPRQLTSGSYHHRGPVSWTADSAALVFAANRNPDWESDRRNTEVYEVSLADRSIKALTDRAGPDELPAVSPDGRQIAYVGFDDEGQCYDNLQLYVMNRDGSGKRSITQSLDRNIRSPVWSKDGKGLFFMTDNQGNTTINYVTLNGQIMTLANNAGGTILGRPYASGSYSIANDGTFTFTITRASHPADVAVRRPASRAQSLTALNADLFAHKTLSQVEEIWYESSADQRKIQGWIVKPPDFDPDEKYPLILEIHGGPFANYGDRFSAEIQLFAAAGYVVLYTNPRGSTSYGQEFSQLIQNNFPGEDYDDLMSGVDALLQRGYIDEEQLFVTGGSGGGLLTSWIVGKNDRFRAAVAAKPVINWVSFTLTADIYPYFYKYWFPGYPWEYPEHYARRSPLTYVGNVNTPTMLLTGERDYRTPMSESEQFYQALKLRDVPAALVRIPGASHGIAYRPTHLISKVAHILKWFEIHGKDSDKPTELLIENSSP